MGLKKVGAAAVIFNGEGHILLVKHGYGHKNWEIPGGGSEPGESVIETAVREVREETGLHVEALYMTGVYYVPEGDGVGFVFLCRITEGAPVVADAAEIIDCVYWPLDALPRPISSWTVQRIQDAVSGQPQPLPVCIAPLSYLE